MRAPRRVLATALALAAVAGPAASASGGPASVPQQRGGVLSDPFFSYDRPAQFPAPPVTRSIRVPVRDGSSIACDLHRPAQADGTPAPGRFPGLVVEYTAYAVGKESTDVEHYVHRGYTALVCDARGSGDSPGELDPFGPQEQQDDYDVIEWMAAQPWSTGAIGQTGVSYGAHTSLLVATRRPPHLRTIVPVMGISDWYENTIYRGGISSPSIHVWEGLTPVLASGGTNPTGPLTMPGNTAVAYAQHPLHDAFWRDRSVAARWDDIDIPVLGLGGWYDRYRDGMTKNQQALRRNMWLVMGPWTHGSPHAQREPVSQGALLAWFDHWLRDDPRAPLPRARVTSYELSGSEDRETGWYQFAGWPVPQAKPQRVSLAADGRLVPTAGAAGSASYVVDPVDAGNDKSHSYPVNQGDQREEDLRRLTWTTLPLAEDTVLAGSVEVVVRASTTARDGNLVVRLMDVAPDGTVTRISAGWKKMSHRDGHQRLSPVVPGQVHDVPVSIWPQHYRFPAGHAIRLSVSSGDFPEIAADAPAGRMTLHTGAGGSSAVLPVLR